MTGLISSWVSQCPTCGDSDDPNYFHDFDMLYEDNDGNDETRVEVWLCKNCGVKWTEEYKYVGHRLLNENNPYWDLLSLVGIREALG